MRLQLMTLVAAAVLFISGGACAGTDYYVRTNGDDANDGSSPAKAKATLAAGMALLTGTGDRLLVGPGDYTNNTAFTVNNGRKVIAEEGAAKTRILASSAYTLFTMDATGGAGEVRGFTVAPVKSRVNCKAFSIASGVFADCVVSNLNSSGAACMTSGADAIVTNCVFYGLGSGDRDAVLEQWSNGRVYDCTFIRCFGNNTFYGGTLMVYNGFARNCLFVDCTNAVAAGGIHMYNGAGTAENCTVVRCVSKTSTTGGGISGSGTVRNCLVWGCSNATGPANISDVTCSYTASLPQPSGTGNRLAFSPKFADPSAGDWRVLAGNTVDAGNRLSWMTDGVLDLAGNPRVAGTAPDLGCYETVPGALACAAAPVASAFVGEQDVTLTASVSGTNLTDLAYSWIVRNASGQVVASADGLAEPTFTHSYGPGQYTVSLHVGNGAGEAADWTSTDSFAIVSDTIYVSDGSTNPTYPYDTWDTATPSVHTAVDAIGEGCAQVVVDDGTYDVTKTITLTRGVTLRSRNGRDRTTLLVKTSSSALTMSHDQARVTGITFLRDVADRSGRLCTFSSGRVDDCTFRRFCSNPTVNVTGTGTFSNCLFSTCGATGRSAFFEHGTQINLDWCTFVDNVFNHTSEYGGLSDGYCTLKFRNCLICRNRYTSDAPSLNYGFVTRMVKSGDLLENCTIVSNTCPNGTKGRKAVVHAAGTIRNCIIAHNTNSSGLADLTTSVPANVTYTLTTTPGTVENLTGCLVADPKIRVSGDKAWHLKSCSPAIDAATRLSWMTDDSYDLDGTPRVRDFGPDMGCYEGDLSGLTVIVK